MPAQGRDLIVIGGSAGAIEAVTSILVALPAELGAAVAVTLHRHPTVPSSLREVLDRRSSLEVIEPQDGTRLAAGRVYLAPQDRHMLIDGRRIRLNRNPQQHHTRPAIDPLFTSAATSAGNRVIGVLLTGSLSDGVGGLIRIKQFGGLSLVQDPSQALAPSMPRNALIYDNVDLILRVESVAEALTRLVGGEPVSALLSMNGVRPPDAEDRRMPPWIARNHRLP
jgi:two-component system chemotaxis response regulator CheB